MRATLLIVDDEKAICAMLSQHYKSMDYQVFTAPDGEDALTVMDDHKVDVIVSDVMMPNMDGIELLRRVRQLYPMVHTIMITGHVSLENILACMRHGADTCIFKPLNDLSELDQAVEDAVRDLERWKRKLRELREIK